MITKYPYDSDKIDMLLNELSHISYLFPEDSNETMTFTAGLVANAFSDWAEIVDNNAVSLSSRHPDCGKHISSFIVESTTVKDKVFIYEISYGDDRTIVARGRIISGTVQLSTIAQERMRNLGIPKEETIYYRMKCETGGASLTATIRYHCDE